VRNPCQKEQQAQLKAVEQLSDEIDTICAVCFNQKQYTFG
jgi:hypothetical protein